MKERFDPVAMATAALQMTSAAILVLSAIAMVVLTGGAIFGAWDWLDLGITRGGEVVPEAGMWAQIGLTVLLLALVGFLPANARVRRLEVTNRDFHISMQDVARAYDCVHQADRDGAFELSREFDAMRDRLEWMRQHPDLGELEHDVLELAAQMSVESRELAQIYSTSKVERAQLFLRQRQKEVEDYRQRIAMAQATVHEIQRWMQAISVEEGLAEKQLQRLHKDLAEITDTLAVVEADIPENVVEIERPRRKEEAAARTKGVSKVARTIAPDAKEPRTKPVRPFFRDAARLPDIDASDDPDDGVDILMIR